MINIMISVQKHIQLHYLCMDSSVSTYPSDIYIHLKINGCGLLQMASYHKWLKVFVVKIKKQNSTKFVPLNLTLNKFVFVLKLL